MLFTFFTFLILLFTFFQSRKVMMLENICHKVFKNVSCGLRIISMINGWTTKLEQIYRLGEVADSLNGQGGNKTPSQQNICHKNFLFTNNSS